MSRLWHKPMGEWTIWDWFGWLVFPRRPTYRLRWQLARDYLAI